MYYVLLLLRNFISHSGRIQDQSRTAPSFQEDVIAHALRFPQARADDAAGAGRPWGGTPSAGAGPGGGCPRGGGALTCCSRSGPLQRPRTHRHLQPRLWHWPWLWQVSTVGFKMDTSVFWASNMFIRPDFLLPQPPHHLKNM